LESAGEGEVLGINPDQVRGRCAGLSADELLKDILVNGGDFVDDAIPIYQGEVKRRLEELQGFLQRYGTASGEIFHRVKVSKFIDRTKNSRGITDGSLIFSTTGIGFLPDNITSLNAPMGIVDGLLETEEKTTPNFSVQNLPIAWLAKLFDSAAWYPTSEIERITRTGGQLLELHGPGGVIGWGTYKGEIEPLETWCTARELEFEQLHGTGFLGSLRARFRKGDAGTT